MEDVGDAEGECKNYAKHSSPGMMQGIISGGHPFARVFMQHGIVRLARFVVVEACCVVEDGSTHHWPYMPARSC